MIKRFYLSDHSSLWSGLYSTLGPILGRLTFFYLLQKVSWICILGILYRPDPLHEDKPQIYEGDQQLYCLSRGLNPIFLQ